MIGFADALPITSLIWKSPKEELAPSGELPYIVWKVQNRMRVEILKCKTNLQRWGLLPADESILGECDAEHMLLEEIKSKDRTLAQLQREYHLLINRLGGSPPVFGRSRLNSETSHERISKKRKLTLLPSDVSIMVSVD
ncbi:hypothetical protein J6590_055740 [Homalodisca vitripennis]|nr:hypothetical protein J6590_055740 [Homalodisca vitripennis]